MRTYNIDSDRRFICDIENGRSVGQIVFDMNDGSILASKPGAMPKIIWIWQVMEFLKICAKMYKPTPSDSNVD